MFQLFSWKKGYLFGLPRSLPVVTSIVALRNLHMHILLPEASQDITWSSSSWPCSRNVLLVSSATSWTYLQVDYHERIGWKQCIILLTDWNNSVCLSGQLPLHCLTSFDEVLYVQCISSIVYILVWQRHLHHLPTGARAGFFIGDGAGVGKGRTVAGLIWENWQQGRHKAL